jgi:hypothetical protein
MERISHFTVHTTWQCRNGTLFTSELNLTHSPHFHPWHLDSSFASCAKPCLCWVNPVDLRFPLPLLSGLGKPQGMVQGLASLLVSSRACLLAASLVAAFAFLSRGCLLFLSQLQEVLTQLPPSPPCGTRTFSHCSVSQNSRPSP